MHDIQETSEDFDRTLRAIKCSAEVYPFLKPQVEDLEEMMKLASGAEGSD